MGRRSGDSFGVSLGRAEVVAISDKAVKVRQLDGSDERWIPRSVIVDDSDLAADADKGDDGELTVASWWARREGLV